MPLISFEQALAQTATRKRHLLLGNGFSIALFPDRFRYDSLLERTDFQAVPQARQAFEALGTADFELVIKALMQTARLAPIYGVQPDTIATLIVHAATLKELLVQAVAGRHPARPSEVSEDQYKACRRFLAHFGGESRSRKPDYRGSIYTLNYDLLLYWALLHDQVLNWNAANPLASVVEQTEEIRHDDGFRSPPEDYDAPYVIWEGEAIHTQCVYFLHGALHLFDYGEDLLKVCWERAGGLPLVDQIRSSLDEGKFPLFVSEGTSSSKLEKIRHSGYLHKALRSLSESCRNQSGSLFIYGHSFNRTDDHILEHIARGKIPTVYVSIFGHEGDPGNRALIERANALRMQREAKFPLEIVYFDAQSARVWG